MNPKQDARKSGLKQALKLRSVTSTLVAIAASLIIAAALYGSKNVTNGGKQPSARSLRGTLATQPQASTMGEWTSPADLCPPDHECLVGGNAAMTLNGNVLFYYYPAPAKMNSGAVLLDTGTGAVTDVSLPFAGDIFCSGMSIMPNGRVLVTGGNLEGVTCGHCGTFTSTIFRPGNSPLWSTGQNMHYGRWYPSTLELGDGTMLELSGNDNTGKKIQSVMESYSYQTNTWKVLPTSANMPAETLHWSSYPRVVLLPSGKVFLAAPDTKTYQFDPSANTWSFVANTNFGFRFYAPHVLLPGLEKVLVPGGTQVEGAPGGAATNTAEVIDFSTGSPAWSYTGSMTYPRENENLVLLADGTVLAVGGGGGGGPYLNAVLTPELYDPNTGEWTVMAPQNVQRTYHSTALLLPDGRVLSAGSNDGGSMEQTYEIFSPPYLFHGPRPVITSAPPPLTYGTAFTIITPDAASITSVALVRPGATTHADNFDQRYVNLSFSAASGQITATAPVSGNYAPPGYYMLVIVNSSGIPSVMRFVYLG